MSLTDAILDALQTKFPKENVKIHFDGKLLVLTITDPQFSGLTALRRQQLVYEIINPWILNKTVHAVQLNLSESLSNK